jgi:hypothetical protein
MDCADYTSRASTNSGDAPVSTLVNCFTNRVLFSGEMMNA